MYTLCAHYCLFSGIPLKASTHQPCGTLDSDEQNPDKGYITLNITVFPYFVITDVVFLRVGQKDMVFSEEELKVLSKVCVGVIV